MPYLHNLLNSLETDWLNQIILVSQKGGNWNKFFFVSVLWKHFSWFMKTTCKASFDRYIGTSIYIFEHSRIWTGSKWTLIISCLIHLFPFFSEVALFSPWFKQKVSKENLTTYFKAYSYRECEIKFDMIRFRQSIVTLNIMRFAHLQIQYFLSCHYFFCAQASWLWIAFYFIDTAMKNWVFLPLREVSQT